MSFTPPTRARGGIRTRDTDHGKVVLYQLSYTRNTGPWFTHPAKS